MQEQERRTHTLMAHGIVDAFRRNPEQYDLEQAIAEMLGYVRRDERVFWLEALQGAAEMCDQQGKHESAAVIRALLESAKHV